MGGVDPSWMLAWIMFDLRGVRGDQLMRHHH